MTTFWTAILVLGVLIVFHELGHFTVAKLVGIKVHEFSIGFGPKLLGHKHGDTVYSLRLFPLGGFVRMAGMDPEEKDVEEGTGFGDKSILQRVGVIFAGPIMNFVLAALLLAGIFIFHGLPVSSTVIDQTIPDRPAAQAGLKAGDRIVSIDDEAVSRWERVVEIISAHPEREIAVTVERDGSHLTRLIVPEVGENGQGLIGVQSRSHFEKQNPLTAIIEGARYTVQVTVLIIDFIGKMIIGEIPADLGGPVRVVYEINRAAEMGFVTLLQLAAFLSINLGLFNLFPIPALDGSRIVFLIFEWIRGKPVDPEKENFIHFIGFGLLLFLVVFITYNDVLQLFVNKGMVP